MYDNLKEVKKQYDDVRSYVESLQDDLYEKNEKEFMTLVNFLPSQSYGNKIEKYLKKKLNLYDVRNMDKGDAVDDNNNYHEIKCSLLDKTNKINIVQIRLWQDVDYYLIGVFIPSEENYYILKLTKDEMEKECDKLNANIAHGNTISTKDNKNVELRLTIQYNSDTFKRWLEQYKIEG